MSRGLISFGMGPAYSQDGAKPIALEPALKPA